MASRTRVVTLAVLLIAFAARLNTLGDVPFWYDEGLVGWAARLPFLETARWTAADVHPPLYFWAVTVWRLFSGETEFALRFLSMTFGFLSVVAVYKIGERIQGPAVGNLAALFIGLSRFHVWWSQELRMYILGSLLMLFSVYLTLRIWHGRPRRADWLAYILVSTAGLYSIYLVAFALAFESCYVTGLLLWRTWRPCARVLRGAGHSPRRTGRTPIPSLPRTTNNVARGRLGGGSGKLFWQWMGAQAIVALLFVPWFLYFLTQFRTWSDSTPFDFALFVQFYSTLLAVGAPSSIDQWLISVIVIWAALIVGALVGLRGPHDGAARRGGWLIVLLLVLPPLSVYLGTTPRSFFYTPRVEARYLFPFIWSFYLVLGWGVWRIGKAQRWLGLVAALVVVVLMGVSLNQYYSSRQPNDVYQSLTATLRAHKQPGDGVLLHDDRTWPIFEFYYANGNKDWKGVPNGSKMRASDADQFLSAFWEGHDAVWMVWNEDALRIDENHALEQWLAEHAVFTREEVFGTKRLIFYARTEERARKVDMLALATRATVATNAQVADGAWLIGYDQPLRRYRVGDEIVLGLYWQSQQSRDVVVVLQDARGAEHARQTVALPVGASRTQVRYRVTTDLDAGDYQIVANSAPIAHAEIVQPNLNSATPDVAIPTPRVVRFQNGIQLLGYDANVTTLRAGDSLPITLYWQTDQPITQRYKVFVHLLGTQWNPKSKNLLWGQHDQEPWNGALPTTSWGVNRTVSDPYLVKIAPDAPPGRYVVEIGWYHPTTGERLPVVGADGARVDDHVNLFEVEVQ